MVERLKERGKKGGKEDRRDEEEGRNLILEHCESIVCE